MIMTMLLAAAAQSASPDPIEAYMLCARRMAVRLEPSGDAAADVARAAVFACQDKEAIALNIDPSRASQLRETALFYAGGQAVAARLCRRTNDCSVAPVGAVARP